uniref:Transglutaminase-like domain-containing protein n=1 Tax=Ciona savignyi TaxID=51511 RepID=H2ZHB5_CIOSA
VLSVKSVELFKDETSLKHYTSEYETNELVIRRGIPFKVLINLSRALKIHETPEFELRMGSRPMVHHGSLIPLKPVDPKPDEDVTGFKLLAKAEDVLTVEIHTSAVNTGIGNWLLTMRVASTNRRRKLPYLKVTNDIIIVFNPWSKVDPVYMKNEEWRNEYVLNEEGMQFYGTSNSIGEMDWYFGQFEALVMKASIKLLNMGSLRYKDHSDPVQVARHMSALVNSQDDNGVLVGNWSGDYKGGKSPGHWNGSAAILKQYANTGKPVKFGQCWVFSGVLTAVLRCLGIPTRSLTTFDSAHDTGGNLTIDKHYDVNGKPTENDDSIWNFHVWNDVWMARPLLPEGYGGWQALDATPQEISEDSRLYQCGPMPVNAIKEGQINVDYDGAFIYAEVNAVEKYWQKLKEPKEIDGKTILYRELSSNSTKVGKRLSTKAVGRNVREDVTHQYKYAEGSKEEELSFKNARKYAKITYTVRKDPKKLVEIISFSVTMSHCHPKGGELQTSRSGLCSYGKTFDVLSEHSSSVVAQILDVDLTKNLSGQKSHTFEVTLPFAAYKETIKGDNNVKFFILGGVTDTDQVFAEQVVVDFKKPTITVKAPAAGQLGKAITVNVKFTNPLPVGLTGGMFSLEGAGVRDEIYVEVGAVS